MRILHEEIQLREETRGLEQERPGLEQPVYAKRAMELAETQSELAGRVHGVTRKIRELPDGEARFPRELMLLSRVEQVMHEATELLAQPNTGPEPIAAETEAIELLLQSKRINPKGGGGGGSSPGGGGTGETDEAALALIGSGAENKADYQPRTVGQATGTSGSQLPAEFRQGLDAFFEALERSGAAAN